MKKNLLFLLGFSMVLTHLAHATLQPGQRFKKVIWIVFENQNFNPSYAQPDFKKAASYGALFTNFAAETHPSQGNYIAMIAGSTMGVTGDGNVNITGNHLGDLIEKARLGWRVYAEDFPGNCYLGASTKAYARKHNPFISFKNVTANKTRCANIIPATTFDDDYKNDTLPELSMYIPNENNDGHDTGVTFAGKYLTKKFGPYISQPDKLKDKLFILTFDESSGAAGNKVYTVLIGNSVIQGSKNSQKVNHVSLLRLLEDEFFLGDLGRGDVSSLSISGIWR